MKYFSPDVSFKLWIFLPKDVVKFKKYDLKKGLNKSMGRVPQALNNYEM